MDWQNERIDLKLPLLISKATNGFLACGYINPETCNKTDEACAIVTGVQDHQMMLSAEVKAVSEAARKLGVTPGMTGKEALARFK